MTDTLRLIDHPLVATLGWTLTHFVWQGALLGLLAFFVLRVLRPQQASTRYLVGIATLAAMLVVPVATFISTSGQTASSQRAWQPAMAPQVSSAGAGAVTGSMTGSFEQNPAALREWLPTRGMPAAMTDAAPIAPLWLPIVTAAWMAGVAVLSLRLVGGWALALLLARRAVRRVSEDVEDAAREMARRLGLRRSFAVMESARVTVPTLVGYVRPVVLVPAAALMGLSHAQLQAVLAHELAHIRRHDYLVNLLQSVVETLLFYHPAVWWVSSEVRAEREHCCDDLAVEVCGDRLVYVSALAELTTIERRAFALAATDGSLVSRVRRILGRSTQAPRELPPSWGILALLVLIGSGAGTYELSGDATAVEQVAQAAAAPDARAVDTARWSERPAAQWPPAPPAPAVPAVPAAPAAPAAPVELPQMRPAPDTPPAPPVMAAPVVPPVPPAPPAPGVSVMPPLPLEAVEPLAVPPPPPPAPMPPMPGVAAPLPPLAPVAPAEMPPPPLPPAGPLGRLQGQKSEGNFTWSNDGQRLTVRWTGQFRLADDERDIAFVEEGARLTIADGWVFTDRIEMRGLPGGGVERKFYRSGVERPFDADGREFLATSLQRMVRSGMFATERVARFLKQGGIDAVLTEIERLNPESSYVNRLYYSALLKQADLSGSQLSRVLDRVAKTVTSDYEKATLLVQVLEESSASDEQRIIAIRAARTISSDYEQKRVLMAGINKGRVSPEMAAAALDAVDTIASAHERGQVLVALVKQGAVTPQTSARFMALVSSMSSGHEQRQVLAAVAASPTLHESVALDAVKAASAIGSAYDKRQAVSAYVSRSDASPKIAAAALASAATISSGHDKAQVLLEVIEKGGVTEATAPAFFSAVTTVPSSYEMTRVLSALVAKGPLGDRVLTGVLEAARKITGSNDRSTLLLTVLKTHTLTGANRTLFLDAADGITSTHEQNQVLAALVRAERR